MVVKRECLVKTENEVVGLSIDRIQIGDEETNVRIAQSTPGVSYFGPRVGISL